MIYEYFYIVLEDRDTHFTDWAFRIILHVCKFLLSHVEWDTRNLTRGNSNGEKKSL